MTFEEVYAAAEELVGELIDEATETRAEVFGLDSRAAFKLWLSDDLTMIIVRASEDRSLQYYGGFEYVDKQYRLELGGYVVYSDEADRVKRCIDRALDVEEEEPPMSPEDVAAAKADLINDSRRLEEE